MISHQTSVSVHKFNKLRQKMFIRKWHVIISMNRNHCIVISKIRIVYHHVVLYNRAFDAS